MKISVVVPTYERPALLARCLKALAGQDFYKKDFEVIVVIDGFDSNTEQVIRKSLSKGLEFSSIRLFENKGPAAARNRGWLRAKGELVAFTDDDCIPSSNWLSTMWNAYSQRSELQIAFSGKVVVPIPDEPSDHALNTAKLQNAHFLTANCACSKKALITIGGFDEQFRMAWREDSDLEFKLILNNIPIIYVENAIVTHPVREAPWSISIMEQKKGMYNALLFKKFPKLYRERIDQKAPVNYYLIILSFAGFLIGLIESS
jgi:glycosyltransferase involved in cell wall biosynthesis